jgi:hypothetical protein
MTKETDDTKDGQEGQETNSSRSEQPPASTAEDVKRKFRDALDKKHAHGGRDVSDEGEHAKIHGAHGPAKAQQMFRRKSGG